MASEKRADPAQVALKKTKPEATLEGFDGLLVGIGGQGALNAVPIEVRVADGKVVSVKKSQTAVLDGVMKRLYMALYEDFTGRRSNKR